MVVKQGLSRLIVWVDSGQSDGSGEDDVSPTMGAGGGEHQFSDQRAPADPGGQASPDLEFGSSTLWSNSSRSISSSNLSM